MQAELSQAEGRLLHVSPNTPDTWFARDVIVAVHFTHKKTTRFEKSVKTCFFQYMDTLAHCCERLSMRV